MALSAGTRLGQYEVRELIGQGGMGEVYRAHDTQLKRDVALKVLPEQFSRDSDRLARFRREAELLASLNHPNIAAIYGIYSEGNRNCLVMELVPGDTLHERVQRDGAVPLEESLDIAKQICEALEHAHEKTVIHRDLKPANVKLTPEGKVKVLDFGLAKAFAGDGTSGGSPKAYLDSNSPTLTSPPELTASPTLPGVILGTAAYMSPEQARGKTVDRRTDIWALGCVLYELLTGKQAFRGEDVTDILAAVVRAEPDWTTLPADTPPGIRVLLRRCLNKDAKRRFHVAADVAIQIEETQAAPESIVPVATIPALPWLRRAIPWTGAVILSVVVGIAVWNLRPAPTPQPVSRVVVPLPPDDRLAGFPGPMVALSPDGTQLAYVASSGGGPQQIYLRAMDALEARPLTGTEGVFNPFFSPDGQWIGFFAGGKLKKVSVSGGATLTLCDAPNPRGASWGPEDTIVFAPSNGQGIWQVPAAGGDPQELITLTEGEISHRWPQFLPDGKTVLFTIGIGGSFNDAHIAVEGLETGDRKVLIRGGTYPRYVPTGHLVYYRAGTMMAVPFDLGQLEVKGTPAPVLEGVMSFSNRGFGQFNFSNLGSLVYIPSGASQVERTLVWVNRQGAEQAIAAPPQPYHYPRLSPDGRRMLVEIEPDLHNVWVYDLGRSTLTRLTFEGANHHPIWTPDANRVTFSASKSGAGDISWRSADGSGNEEQLTTGEYRHSPQSWSPDGKLLVFVEGHSTTYEDIWVLPLEGERKPRPYLQTPFRETTPALTADGHWLAYVSDESGRLEVYVQPFPSPSGKRQISNDGGQEPVWARNGRELFYRNGSSMMAVEITTNPTFSAGTSKLLFEGEYNSNSSRTEYDVAPDGQRFLMIKAADQEEEEATQINVVLNWFEELKAKVPTGN